eukprot:3934041-Amphidinium_carterae.1
MSCLLQVTSRRSRPGLEGIAVRIATAISLRTRCSKYLSNRQTFWAWPFEVRVCSLVISARPSFETNLHVVKIGRVIVMGREEEHHEKEHQKGLRANRKEARKRARKETSSDAAAISKRWNHTA